MSIMILIDSCDPSIKRLFDSTINIHPAFDSTTTAINKKKKIQEIEQVVGERNKQQNYGD